MFVFKCPQNFILNSGKKGIKLNKNFFSGMYSRKIAVSEMIVDQ